MINKLEYLQKYNRKIQILEAQQLLQYFDKIPPKWIEVIIETDILLKINKTMEFWEDIVGVELRNTILYLKKHLVSLDVLYDGKFFSILYGVKSPKGNILYYEGRLPSFSGNDSKLPGMIENNENIPQVLSAFYAQLHNGFYYYASHSMGLLPLDEIIFLGEYDWGIIDELKDPLQLDINRSFGFFTNGIGAYVVVDISECGTKQATLWFKNKAPKYNLDFWDVVDEWIVLGFDG